ncbi:MAG TPA: thrombospondin type 3 repeat-containing protein, partial [Gemmatimonadales bacterium]|nr:thrombospondin type 3 repeat-containing protein [Gemmatimonadales bacterium]
CPAVSVPGSGPCGAAGSLQAGAGVRISLSPTLFMRYEAIVNRSLTTLKFSNYAIQGGLSLMLGSHPLVDSDGDGVWDRDDRCPGTPLGALVDRHGCPTDHDGDGVPDGLDRCPLTPPGATVDQAGCTMDSDSDGVVDGLDQCPDTPKGALVDEHGCPIDSDSDGVYDGLDRCPNTPAGATVDALGCPSDTDGDGVPDGLDLCPDTHHGVAVDDKGCPLAPEPDTTGAAAQAEWIVPGEVWKYRGWNLSPEAYPILDSVVTVMKKDPATQAEVDGYAHDRLVPVDNTRLSQRRAEVVRDYIISKGVGLGRVTAVGRGSETLLVADTTDAARTANRRVEIHVTRKP